ncbi:MAG: heme-binding domain-containing protein [Bacteroidota bacterium]
MKNTGRIILYIFLGSFIFIQFFGVERNQREEISPDDFLKQNPSLPEALILNIKTSCYDCHSDHTNYPWYAQVAPFSWIIDQHIDNGKQELNLSEYGSLDAKQKISVLNDICEAISDSTMPPANYLMLHQDAALDADDITAICDWADEKAMFIMRNR